MNHHALNRIVTQIKEHTEELRTPPSLPDSERSVPNEIPPLTGEPLEDVSNIFQKEDLRTREDALRIEKEIKQAEGEKLRAESEAQEKIKLKEKEAFQKEFGKEETEEEDDEYPDHMPIENMPPDVRKELEEEKDSYRFNSIYDLRDFLVMNRSRFDDWQLGAVDSIVNAVKSITAGCKCKKEARKKAVEDYYKQFILHNKDTALIPKLKELANAEKIIFSSFDEIFFEG